MSWFENPAAQKLARSFAVSNPDPRGQLRDFVDVLPRLFRHAELAVAETGFDLDTTLGPAVVLAAVAERLDRLREKADQPLRGVGVCVPGPVVVMDWRVVPGAAFSLPAPGTLGNLQSLRPAAAPSGISPTAIATCSWWTPTRISIRPRRSC